MFIRQLFVLVFLFVFIFGNESLWARKNQSITLAGSSTVAPLMEIISEEYEKHFSSIRIDVQGGGSALGVSAPLKGLADIGMVSRALREKESSLLFKTTIAKDGIALIVHRSNGVKSLNHQDVFKIYSGEFTRWDQMGGKESSIIVINKEDGRATRDLFQRFFNLKGKFIKSALIIGPNGQAIVSTCQFSGLKFPS